jgi:hypothetical protein
LTGKGWHVTGIDPNKGSRGQTELL